MTIRESKISELDSIYALHVDAFGEPEGTIVAQLACDILNDETAKPIYSFVAESQEEIVGHIVFSTLKIEGFKGVSAYILAPLAVSKSHQKQGLGTQLIEYGLNRLKAQGAEVVFVLGDPNYYERSGFKAGHKVLAPYELEYPEAWLAKELKIGVLSEVRGVAKCASVLMSKEHW